MTSQPTKRALTAARCAVVVFLVGGTLWVAPGAQADPTITFEICEEPTEAPDPTESPDPTPTPAPCTPRADTVVGAGVLVVFDVQVDGFQEDLAEVELLVESSTAGVPSETKVRTWPAEETAPGRFVHEWNSAAIPGYNGAFTLTVRAVSDPFGPGENRPSKKSHGPLLVDNPPKLPQKPEIAGVSADGVSVGWPVAAEPDVQSYTLYRARTGSADEEPPDEAFKSVLVTQKTSTLDEVSEGGAYWYKVQVTRRSVVTPDEGISSGLSARSDRAGVYVPPVPTSPPPESTGGDGDGEETRTPRPGLTPRPLPRPSSRNGPPLPEDAPFSDILPYDLPQGGGGGAASGELDREPGDGDQGALPAVAIGTFLVSAALALGRLPT